MITKRKENSKCDKLVEQSLESSIRDFIEIFQSSDMAEEYFAEYIDSFSRCLDNLKNRKVSVGVIGITSSGKSTLLNAILGEKILPQKVRPSSGVQVICEFGEKLEAEIYFKKESGKPVKKVTSHIYATLEKYGDECKNPANKEDVEEIRVYSPSFRLGKNISLVDTPGLDAYELKNHEEITLRLVLPSVQMIMFLTTVKASSDQKNLEIIDSVTTDDKPLIVVQNMIDSINPKESIRGIEKNQEEVRREHFDRVTRLLGKAEKKSVKNAPVIQVSAKNALNGDWNGSGLAHLEKGLKLLLEKNKPRVLTLFKSQIACRLKVIREGLDASDEKEQIYENNLQKLKQIEDKLKRDENYFDQKRETIDEIIEGISSEAWNLIERIHRYYMENARDISQDNYDITTKTIGDTVYRKLKNWDNNFKQEQDRIKQAMEDSFLQLNTLMKNIEKLLKDLCENDKLNLQQIDIIKRSGTTYFSANIAIPIKQISEKHCDLIEIPWYRGGGVRRCWGSLFGSDAGYDKNEYDVTVDYIDIQKMLFNMLNKLREWRTCLGDKLQEFADNTLYSFKKMNKELTGQVNSLEKTRTVVIEHEIRDRVLHMIDVFIGHDKINNESCEAITNPTEVFLADPENLKQTEQDCNALSLALYRLSKIVSFKRLYNARDVILKDAGSSDCKTLVLWGWDSNYLNILVASQNGDLSSNSAG